MKRDTALGSRIAEVHNGSSLFTGDAGQGEQHPPLDHRERLARSDRRAAAQHVLQHRHRHLRLGAHATASPSHRRGKVQLIDASQWFKPLRKNLGMKNCELSEDDIRRICEAFLDFEETEQSRIFANAGLRLLEGDGRAPSARRRARTHGARLPAGRDQGPARQRRPDRIRAAGHQEAAQAGHRARPAARALRGADRSPARPGWSSTSRTPTCATPSRSRCRRRAASTPSSSARCCPTRPTPGYDEAPPRSATRSPSPATSTSPSRCARSRRFAPTSWRWRRRPMGCWADLGEEARRMREILGKAKTVRELLERREVLDRLLPARVQVARRSRFAS